MVERPDFLLGQPNPWPEAFAAFSDQIAGHVGKLRDLVVADFSTTGPLERAATEVLLMDTFQGYFEYEMMCGCGIPQITLRGTPDVVLTTAQFCGTLLFGIVVAPFGWITPSLADFSLFVIAGCISIIAAMGVNRSLKLAPASVVVPYQYTMIIWAVMFGYLVFGDVPSLAMLIGAAIIILAGLYIFLRERDLIREQPVVVPPPG